MYADTSALMKMLVEERETSDLRAYVEDQQEISIATSEYTVAELHRTARRASVHPDLIDALLDGLDLVPVTLEGLRYAGRLPSPPEGFLRTADALHVSAALLIGERAFATYDTRQAAAARSVQLRVLSPGA